MLQPQQPGLVRAWIPPKDLFDHHHKTFNYEMDWMKERCPKKISGLGGCG